MTTRTENLANSVPAGPLAGSGRRRGAWRFAIRLARREIRRRPGRTLLVMLLVAVPVCGMTVVTVLVRTNNDSAAEEFARRFGAADLVARSIDQASGRPSASPTVTFPAGTRRVHAHDSASFSSSEVGLATADGTARLAEVTDLDLNDPIARGIVLLRSGRFPSRAGEALLSPKLARAFGMTVGDTLHLETPNWTEKVVGIGVRATNWSQGLLAVRGAEIGSEKDVERGVASAIELIDLPGNPSDAELVEYPQSYLSRASMATRTPERAVNWVLVGGIVALAIVGIVISGAFAVGARRQLVTLGQLSANGADERLLRRTLSLQGLLAGAIGSALGFGVGVVLLLGLRGEFSQWIHHNPGPYVWSGRDTVAVLVTGVVAATIAAFIPARSAARVPVLSALAGRRPLGTLPKRLVPIGSALFAGGVFVLVLVATASGARQSDGLALSAVVGGLLVLAGACCASSVVVAGLGNAGRAASGAARVAIRSVVRSRARSAAVVMALAAINAGAIAVGTAIESHTGAEAHDAQLMPDDTLIVSSGGDLSGDVRRFLPPPASVVSTLHRVLPGAQWSTRRAVIGSGSDIGAAEAVRNGGLAIATDATGSTKTFAPPLVTVADPAVLEILGLSARDSATLQRSGVIVVRAPLSATGKARRTVPVTVGSAPAQTIDAAVAQDAARATGDSGGFFITEAKARALRLPIVDAGAIIRNPKPLDESQRASIDVLAQSLFLGAANTSTTVNIAWSGTVTRPLSTSEVRQILLGIVLFIALIVLAMSLALSAAETRDERDILVSLGARPSTMRAVSGWKAALLAISGALVAVPTGFIPVAVVVLALVKPGETAHIVFPWSATLQLVMVAPVIAGLVAYAGSAIAQALRPTRMSTFATD